MFEIFLIMFQFFLAMVRNLALSSRKLPHKKAGDPVILNLNDDILRQIYQELPLVDQACLSLCCKRLFALFGTIVKREEFFFPRLLHIRIPRLCINNPAVPRNQLLIRLENVRWAYCAVCLKLHPRKEFPNRLIKLPPIQRYCAEYAGIADLCPCISLTLRDRARLIEVLKSPAPPPHRDPKDHFEFLFDHEGKPSLQHSCEIGLNLRYKAQIHLTLFIEKSTNQLMMRAQYNFYFTSYQFFIFGEPIFICPHLELLAFVIKRMISTTCPHCGTRALCPTSDYTDPSVKWCRPSYGTTPVTVNATRALGSCTWQADLQWYKQSRLTAKSYGHYKILWRRSQAMKEEARRL